MRQQFGGGWTEEKLTRLRKYLEAYITIFEGNERARSFTRYYIDAFAGTGYREDKDRSLTELIPELTQEGTQRYYAGSVKNALDLQPGFHRFLFIEKSRRNCLQLARLKELYPALKERIQIEQADANSFLQQWIPKQNWTNSRAVLFLDPFGMQLEWTTLETIANTHAIDTWLLFPIGMGVNRMLTRNELPPDAWASRLTQALGTEAWKREFYTDTLFEEYQQKNADFDKIARFFVSRLQTAFAGVAERPLVLRNSSGSPLFLLCFATGALKPSAQAAALRIASDLLKEEP